MIENVVVDISLKMNNFFVVRTKKPALQNNLSFLLTAKRGDLLLRHFLLVENVVNSEFSKSEIC